MGAHADANADADDGDEQRCTENDACCCAKCRLFGAFIGEVESTDGSVAGDDNDGR